MSINNILSLKEEASELVKGMLKRNPELAYQVGQPEGVSLEEFAYAILIQYKSRNGIV